MFQTWRLSKCGRMYIRETRFLAKKSAIIKRARQPFLSLRRGDILSASQNPKIQREGKTMCRILRTFAVVAGLVLLMSTPLVANAYTIIMRDGRRIEIPDNFEVGPSTLTYETSPGFQVTLQLSTIDIYATERINRQPIGSLVQHSNPPKTQPAPVRTKASKAVTNADLEKFRRKRIASEVAYERRRKELGLPSVEQSRLEAMAITDRMHDQLVNKRAADEESEEYWRQRAGDLRVDLVETNSRINQIQTRLNELSSNGPFGSYNSPFLSVDQLAYGTAYPGYGTAYPVYPNGVLLGRQGIGARVGLGNYGNYGRGAYNPYNPYNPYNRYGRSRYGRRSIYNNGPFGNVVALPYDYYDNSYERSQLMTELDQQVIRRAGLEARWREFEEEARRKGAYPGWLR